MINETRNTNEAEWATAHGEPSAADWKVADALWKLLEAMPREKARTIVTSLISGCPTTVAYARNILKEHEAA